MPESFDCPNCGAPLDYKGHDPIIRCPYCSSSVIVPENLRSKPSFSPRADNFTVRGFGDMGRLISQASRFKDVKDLAQAGNLDEAVRLYCEITGSDPESARAPVQALAHGLPITINEMNLGEVMSSIKAAAAPSIKLDLDPPQKASRPLGCLIGCFVVGLVVFILAVTLVPVLLTTVGIAAGTNPGLVLTSLPKLPGTSGVSGFAAQDLSFGGEGTGPGLFGDVRAIAVDPTSGSIFAANYDGGRVQAFDPQGKYITQWIVEGKNPYIQDMAASRDGKIYIVVFGKILVYDIKGKFQAAIEPLDSRTHYEDIALLADGSLMVVSRGEDIVHLSASGQVLDQFEAAVSTVSGDSELSSKAAVDGLGNIYVLGTFNNAVFVFSPQGKFINRFGSDGDEPGQLRAPSAIAVDGKGRVYVSDIKGVQVFSNDGRYINVIKVEYFAYGLAFDDQGKLYVTTNQKKVERYNIPQ